MCVCGRGRVAVGASDADGEALRLNLAFEASDCASAERAHDLAQLKIEFQSSTPTDPNSKVVCRSLIRFVNSIGEIRSGILPWRNEKLLYEVLQPYNTILYRVLVHAKWQRGKFTYKQKIRIMHSST